MPDVCIHVTDEQWLLIRAHRTLLGLETKLFELAEKYNDRSCDEDSCKAVGETRELLREIEDLRLPLVARLKTEVDKIQMQLPRKS